MRTACGVQTHFLVRSDVRPAGIVFEHAGGAFYEAGFDASIADSLGEFFFINLGDLIHSGAEGHEELKVGAAEVFLVETGGADDPHAGLDRRLGHEVHVAAQVGRAGIHESIHAVRPEFLQTIDAEFERLIAFEAFDGDAVRFPAGPGDQQMFMHQGRPQFLRSASAGDGVDLQHRYLLFSYLTAKLGNSPLASCHSAVMSWTIASGGPLLHKTTSCSRRLISPSATISTLPS